MTKAERDAYRAGADWGCSMPRYDYRCSSCHEIVEVSMSMSLAGTVCVGHPHLVWAPVISNRPMRDAFPMTLVCTTTPSIAPDGTYSHKT